jgi:hypothetical protein
MTLVEFTTDDIANSQGQELHEPGWYNLEVTKINEKPSADGQSTNAWTTFKILDGERAGKLITTNFNSKAAWAKIPLFKAILGEVKPGQGYDFSEQTLKGQKVAGYNENKNVNGEVRNNLRDFKPYGS